MIIVNSRLSLDTVKKRAFLLAAVGLQALGLLFLATRSPAAADDAQSTTFIIGQIVDGQGAPVSGALVELRAGQAGRGPRVRCSPSGVILDSEIDPYGIGRGDDDDRAAKPAWTQIVFDELLHLPAALADEPDDRDVGPGVARKHGEQNRLADARAGKNAHALTFAAGDERVERPHAQIDGLT